MENLVEKPDTCDAGCPDCDVVMQIMDAKEELPAHLRDYAEEIQSFVKKYPSFVAMFGRTSMRRMMWDVFGGIVAMHIDKYAEKQYGDYPNDQLANWSADQCIKQVQKYMARWDTNARGADERLLDLLKMAHYISVAFLKLRDYEKYFVIPDELPNTGDMHLS